MKSVENTRGELFEAWWDSLASHWSDKSARIAAWQAFNAALDSVVIELPGKIGEEHGGDFYTASIHDSVIAECRDAIESTNLGIKLK